MVGHALEEDVDAGAKEHIPRFFAIFERAALRQHDVVVGAGHQHGSGLRSFAPFCHADGMAGAFRQPLGQPLRKGNVHVLHDDHGHVPITWQRHEQVGDGLGAPGRRADHEQPRCGGSVVAPRGPPMIGGDAHEFGDGCDLPDEGPGSRHFARRPQHGGVDRIQRAKPHGIVDERDVSADRGGDDQDRARAARHDLPGGLHAVHVRHDQIHQDQVRTVALRHRDRLHAVGCRPGNGVVGQAAHHAAQRLAGGPHVVDNRNSQVLRLPAATPTWASIQSVGSPIRSMIVLRKVWSWKLVFVR